MVILRTRLSSSNLRSSIRILKGKAMKTIITAVLLTAAVAQAQVYVPGPGYPLCFPQTVATPGGLQTVVICQ